MVGWLTGCVCTCSIIFLNTGKIHVKFATNILCDTAANTVNNLHFFKWPQCPFCPHFSLNDHKIHYLFHFRLPLLLLINNCLRTIAVKKGALLIERGAQFLIVSRGEQCLLFIRPIYCHRSMKTAVVCLSFWKPTTRRRTMP